MPEKNVMAGVATNIKEISMTDANYITPEYLKKNHGYKGYHGTADEINTKIRELHLPKFEHTNPVKSPGKLFLTKLLLLMFSRKNSWKKSKKIYISPKDWEGLLHHYIGVRDSIPVLRKYFNYWTGKKGVLKKEKGVKNLYSLTPENSHIYKQIPSVSRSDKKKSKASEATLFVKEKINSDLFEVFVEDFSQVAM